jgi:hypothetical protein
MLALLYAVMLWRRLLERFYQAATALAGTGTLFGVLGLPLVYGLLGPEQLEGDPSAAILVWLVLVVWSLVVIAHILRHSLDLPFPLAALAAVLYVAISQQVLGMLSSNGG